MILEKGNKKLHPPPDKNALLKSYRSKQGKHVKKLQSFTSEYIFRFVTIPPSFCHTYHQCFDFAISHNLPLSQTHSEVICH